LEKTMKIGPPADRSTATAAEAKLATGGAAKAKVGPTGTTPTDVSAKVRLSDAVSGMLAGKDPVGEVFDAAKVERLATAIAQGKFVVSPAAVADKLIANAQELLSKKSH
jgi:negative regulator of flagellin synthesis FlgM